MSKIKSVFFIFLFSSCTNTGKEIVSDGNCNSKVRKNFGNITYIPFCSEGGELDSMTEKLSKFLGNNETKATTINIQDSKGMREACKQIKLEESSRKLESISENDIFEGSLNTAHELNFNGQRVLLPKWEISKGSTYLDFGQKKGGIFSILLKEPNSKKNVQVTITNSPNESLINKIFYFSFGKFEYIFNSNLDTEFNKIKWVNTHDLNCNSSDLKSDLIPLVMLYRVLISSTSFEKTDLKGHIGVFNGDKFLIFSQKTWKLGENSERQSVMQWTLVKLNRNFKDFEITFSSVDEELIKSAVSTFLSQGQTLKSEHHREIQNLLKYAL